MSIKVKKIISQKGEFTKVLLIHGENEMTALIKSKIDTLINFIGSQTNIIVELDYEKLIAAKVISDFDNSDSAIATKDDHYIIRGSVSQIIKMENDTLIDLYLYTGPEFITILKSETHGIDFEVDQGIEIEIAGLMFLP